MKISYPLVSQWETGQCGSILGDVRGDISRETDSIIYETSSIERWELKPLLSAFNGDS